MEKRELENIFLGKDKDSKRFFFHQNSCTLIFWCYNVVRETRIKLI